MPTFKSWVSALRPRTLFLAIASTLCGSSIAYSIGLFSWSVCLLTILTATALQLLSNMANDLGDYQHGTDITGHRVGPKRTVQSGAITPSQMKRGILVAISISIVSGLGLIYEALQFMQAIYVIIFLLLGAACIVAAMKYTTGKNPYGYRGWGDVFAFLFFGPVAVVGTYFLHTHILHFRAWLPAIGIGLFTAAVLNINNMRDMENDRNSGKMTFAIKLGLNGAKRYHAFLTFGGIACFFLYGLLYSSLWYQQLYNIASLAFIKILIDIYRTKENRMLDPYLKYTSLSTFMLAVIFSVCINLYS